MAEVGASWLDRPGPYSPENALAEANCPNVCSETNNMRQLVRNLPKSRENQKIISRIHRNELPIQLQSWDLWMFIVPNVYVNPIPGARCCCTKKVRSSQASYNTETVNLFLAVGGCGISSCVDMYLCINASMHQCIYMYLHESTCIKMYLNVSTCIYMYLHVSKCIYIYLYVSKCI